MGNIANCKSSCKASTTCGKSYEKECDDYCSYFPEKTNTKGNRTRMIKGPFPCNYTETSGSTWSKDFILVDVSNQTDYEALMRAFTPLYNETAQYYANLDWDDNCGSWIDSSDIFMTSMGWIPEYKKWLAYDGDLGEKRVLSSPAHYFYNSYNLYDQSMPSKAYVPDLCYLKKISGTHVGVGIDEDDYGGITYRALQPNYVYLLKKTTGSDGTDRIGSCELDASTSLPKIRTYGWCEPCTLTTMAYQSVKTVKNPYLPYLEYNTETGKSSTLCTYDQKYNTSGSYYYKYFLTSCYAPHITDISDYSGTDITETGVPRTEPEATLIKERMGNYLKSGIMPIIDLSDDSNWNKTSFYQTSDAFSFTTSEASQYSKYDFEPLLSNSGPIVVVVDNANVSMDTTRILKRANLIRSYCWRCLIAVHVTPYEQGVDKYQELIDQLFADPRMSLSVDLVTFEHMVTKEYDTNDSVNRSLAAVDEMEDFGRASLKKYGKPSMITDFSVAENSNWNDSNYETLFTTIVEKEDSLVNAGIFGVLYSNVRSKYGAGLEDTTTPVAVKTPKFCAFERATMLLGVTRPYAQFSKSSALSTANCTKCTSLEISLNTCNTTCANGQVCTLPSSATASTYRCPDQTVIEPCTLCNQTSGIFLCNKTFVNGTVVPFNVSSQDVNSDIYGEIVGGLEDNKCCLQTSAGTNYTFFKKTLANIINAPIVFPKSGDESADCSMTSSQTLSSAGEFCGAKLPVQDYDMECTFEYVPPGMMSAAKIKYNVLTPDQFVLVTPS